MTDAAEAFPRVAIIACAAVIEELRELLPPGTACHVIDAGLHRRPDVLRERLQEAIDAATEADTVLLAYGRCSRAVIGLRARHCRLVIPRVDDCIALFLGSRREAEEQSALEPGTYYLTRGWIASGQSHLDEERRLTARHGAARAVRLLDVMFRNYTRLSYIETGEDASQVAGPGDRRVSGPGARPGAGTSAGAGTGPIDLHRGHAQAAAERLRLRFETLDGSTRLLARLLRGPWDDEVVVVEPGEVVTPERFDPRLSPLACPVP